jgi:hypothetical protein
MSRGGEARCRARRLFAGSARLLSVKVADEAGPNLPGKRLAQVEESATRAVGR